jgi:hypothetical protein
MVVERVLYNSVFIHEHVLEAIAESLRASLDSDKLFRPEFHETVLLNICVFESIVAPCLYSRVVSYLKRHSYLSLTSLFIS